MIVREDLRMASEQILNILVPALEVINAMTQTVEDLIDEDEVDAEDIEKIANQYTELEMAIDDLGIAVEVLEAIGEEEE